jgi:hypothetical protein
VSTTYRAIAWFRHLWLGRAIVDSIHRREEG